MSACATPDDGDIVVELQNRDGRHGYVLYPMPDPAEYALRYSTLNEAVAQAVTVAKRQRVRVWLSGEGHGFTLVENFREVTMPLQNAIERIRAEYLEMPGLSLTLEQAQRLCGVERAVCQEVLRALVDAKFLCVKANGGYARSTEGAFPRPQPAKAHLGAGKRIEAAS